MNGKKNELVLIVGGTGHLGFKVVRELVRQGRRVRALVRPETDARRLEQLPVEIVPGDLMDPRSLSRAAAGVDAIITTAAGYMRRRKTDTPEIDRSGNFNLVDAARAAGVERLVFTSVLNCELAESVPHFWNKKLVEDHMEESGVPFVSVRPGAFIDQGRDYLLEGVRKGRVLAIGDPDLRYTQVLTEDVARYLVLALDVPAAVGQRINIGYNRAASAVEVASVLSRLLGRKVRARAVPWWLANATLAAAGWMSEAARDFHAMLKFAQTGQYVADTTLQGQLFGEPPSMEDALRRWVVETGLAPQMGRIEGGVS
jgi:uncharacterized protein YbjT (DUF2867 family)